MEIVRYMEIIFTFAFYMKQIAGNTGFNFGAFFFYGEKRA